MSSDEGGDQQENTMQEELPTEAEQDDVPYVEFDISVSPSDPQLQTISQQLSDDDIIVPFYQRRYVWKIDQASRLIESFLMGLPVPQVFLYQNDEEQLEVIDGQQRLLSIHYFLTGFFGDEDASGRRRIFKLRGLSERSEYNGRTFEELSDRDKRKLKNSTIRAINIRQLTPKGGAESVFHIFERLNTGGTQLKPQEIRNAVYRGDIVEKLRELNDNSDWRSIIGLKAPDKSQKDIELILRLSSLFEAWQFYEKPMLRHLNIYMSEHREWKHALAEKFEVNFSRVAKLVSENLDRPFRPRTVINAAVLESVFLALMENPSIDGAKLSANYEKLFLSNEYNDRITGGTTDTTVLRGRIEEASKILAA